ARAGATPTAGRPRHRCRRPAGSAPEAGGRRRSDGGADRSDRRRAGADGRRAAGTVAGPGLWHGIGAQRQAPETQATRVRFAHDRGQLIGDTDRQVHSALSQAAPGAQITAVKGIFDAIAELSGGSYTTVLAAAEPIERRPAAA